MKLLNLIAALALLSISVSSTANSPVISPEQIDAIFSDWGSGNVPGASIGVIKDGQFIFKTGYGMANLEYGIPNSPTSVFRIASTSKQFTAACIIHLALSEKLSLDDSLHQFFPDFPEYAKRITVRQLLNHTSGMRDYLTLTYLAGYADNDHFTNNDVMKLLVQQHELNFTPGEQFNYSNSGYWLLGQIVEEVSGMSLRDYADKHLFKPLGMLNTHFHDDHTHIVKNRSSGYGQGENGQFKISMTTLDMVGDGGIYTTIEDMKKWDDSYYQSDVLPEQFWKLMLTTGQLNSGEPITYASGLVVSEYKGQEVISHGGAFVGYRAQFIRFPEHKLSVIVFANRADANPTEKAYAVADLFLGTPDALSSFAQPPTEESSTASVTLSEAALKQWVGDYWFEEDGLSRRIDIADGNLVYVRSQSNKSKLAAVSENEFVFVDFPDAKLRFEKGEKNLNTMSLITATQPPRLGLQYHKVTLSAAELAKYQGDYYSDELDVIYALTLKDNVLVLSVDGKESTAMKPLTTTTFQSDNYGVIFFDGVDGELIPSFRLNIGRVSNMLFERVDE